MFGERVDAHIAMLQRVVALLRDLVVAVLAGLTAVIVAYGGDPTKLTALDWTTLVGASFLIVVGPLAVFFAVKLIFRLLSRLLAWPSLLSLADGRTPKGLYAWFAIRVFGVQRREYLKTVRTLRRHIAALARRYPRAWGVYRTIATFADRYQSFQDRTNPYLLALIALVVATVVFRNTLRHYIP